MAPFRNYAPDIHTHIIYIIYIFITSYKERLLKLKEVILMMRLIDLHLV